MSHAEVVWPRVCQVCFDSEGVGAPGVMTLCTSSRPSLMSGSFMRHKLRHKRKITERPVLNFFLPSLFAPVTGGVNTTG